MASEIGPVLIGWRQFSSPTQMHSKLRLTAGFFRMTRKQQGHHVQMSPSTATRRISSRSMM